MVSQGSVLGLILFSVFISPISKLVSNFEILHQHYADDAQLYIAFSPSHPNSGISKHEFCLTSLHSWFSHNGLCLNPTKSEAIMFGTQQRLHHFPSISSINTPGSLVSLSDKISTMGVTLDTTLPFNSHVFVSVKLQTFTYTLLIISVLF
jgi:Reverse transcriptase (RNA-dependent DNA polymerase)